MQELRAVVLLLVLSTMVGCGQEASSGQSQAEDSPAQAAQDGAAVIDSLREQYVSSFNRGDAAAVAAFYAEDAVLGPGVGGLVRGRAEIQEALARRMGGGRQVTVEPMVTYSSGDLAYSTGKVAFTGGPPDAGGQAASVRNNFLIVFRRQADGTWKLVAHLQNQDQPAAQQSGAPR